MTDNDQTTEVQAEPVIDDQEETFNMKATPDDAESCNSPMGTVATPHAESEPDSFSREYVEKLRQENGKYRQRAQRADDLAHRLHRELVRSDGRLQDPTDLDFSDDHLADDGVSLTEAIDDLLKRKPHLAARRPIGDVGQGATTTAGEVNLLGILGGR